MIFQYSISSEFNKTIKDKKNKLETNLYNEYIIEKFILLILKEIKKNYSRIYDNISVPYKANYEQIIVASFLQDNELLNDCYKELKVKEELKNIINKKEILEKFNSINKKIRKKKGLEENNYYDNLTLENSFKIFNTLSFSKETSTLSLSLFLSSEFSPSSSFSFPSSSSSSSFFTFLFDL